ncbi:sialin-like [Anneissia japonica]|uniref:sialin-like n=1 Tax=Anneissia japonica TaxID=1529436 RepID=UPI00142585C5|nr:sialin-like [Anneissia japonica]XP_033113163.1 sialin-like [Anneissia japonica]XP_033113164.1 sialin-like [Anneissia japonica]
MVFNKASNEEKEPLLQNVDSPPRLPIRYIILFFCFMANTINNGMRINWSIAILAMVSKKKLDQSNLSAEVLLGDNGTESYDWDMETQQIILGAFYYGYTFTPFLGGWLVGKVGGFRVLFTGVLLSSVMMLLTAISARISVALLILTRVIDGTGQGVVYPATYSIIAKWSKLNERSTFISVSSSGYSIGAIVSSYVSAWLCSSCFLGGWPSTFYGVGISGIILCFGWFIIGSNDAANNRWISNYEKKLILSSRTEDTQSENNLDKVPWKSILTSAPVWSLCVCNVGFDYGYYFLSADVPIFFKTILGFQIKTTGLLTLLPQSAMFITMILGGVLADKLIFSGTLRIITMRKIFGFLGLGVSSVLLVSLGYFRNDITIVAILMVGVFAMYGFFIPGIDANTIDIAPNHSALLIGIMFSISSLTGFIGPAVLGALTNSTNTIIQWREVFWIVAGVQAFGLVAFLIFGSGNEQDWN